MGVLPNVCQISLDYFKIFWAFLLLPLFGGFFGFFVVAILRFFLLITGFTCFSHVTHVFQEGSLSVQPTNPDILNDLDSVQASITIIIKYYNDDSYSR